MASQPANHNAPGRNSRHSDQDSRRGSNGSTVPPMGPTRSGGSGGSGGPSSKNGSRRRAHTPEMDGCLFGFYQNIGKSCCNQQAGHHADNAHDSELNALVAKMKKEIMNEVRRDVQETMLTTRREMETSLMQMGAEIRMLKHELAVVKTQLNKGPLSRFLTCFPRKPTEDTSTVPKTRDDPEPQIVPSTMVPGGQGLSSAMHHPVPVPAPSLVEVAPSAATTVCLLQPVVSHFSAASRLLAEAKEIEREPFLDGLSEYAKLLNQLGGNLGSYLDNNIKKLRASKADGNKSGYHEWLMTELHVHSATSYKEYVDDSAWMANLWVGRTLEFFVELFEELHKGQETKAAADAAYQRTLSKHHSFIQRYAFNMGVAQLPVREKMFELLLGSTGSKEALREEMAEFVRLSKLLAIFCLETDKELDQRLKVERKSFLKR